MKSWWLRFGCFLIGYNYPILKNCSEVSKKQVKKYSAAMLIVSLLWGFVGYTFTSRYISPNLQAETTSMGYDWAAIAGAFVMVIVIIQVERQIILTVHKNNWLIAFRVVIALVMAVIGSITIDQIIFKEDIERRNITNATLQADSLVENRAKEIDESILDIDLQIAQKESEIDTMLARVQKEPRITLPKTENERQTVRVPYNRDDGSTAYKDSIIRITRTSTETFENPLVARIIEEQKFLERLLDDRQGLQQQRLTLRLDTEKELKENKAFLDELDVMFQILRESWAAVIVYLLWAIFILGLECLIVVSKIGETESDYTHIIKHHYQINLAKLEELARTKENTLTSLSNGSVGSDGKRNS